MSANNVIGQVVGGQKRVFDDCSTVGDIRAKLGIGANYAGAIEGVNQPDSAQLHDNQYVSFSEQVKGAYTQVKGA